jgi:hypothetical protein
MFATYVSLLTLALGATAQLMINTPGTPQRSDGKTEADPIGLQPPSCSTSSPWRRPIFGLIAIARCQPVLLQWSGGSAPYFINVIPAGEVSAAPLERLPQQTGTSYTW